MSRSERLVTLGVMLGIFMASMEITVVATAMPTIVSQIGGLATYSWVFSAYLLASTTTVPLFGKLSDLYGRRRVYAVAIGLFLVGSLLCGMARSMPLLIAFRVVQGLGAGGVLPLAFIIIGGLFTLERRARMQGVFASVWGVSAVVGPLIGGFIVDRVSWPWVFYVNVIPGLLALALVWIFLEEEPSTDRATVRADFLGAGLLTAGVVALLLGLFELRTGGGWPLLAAAAGLFVALTWVERRAPDPVVPVALFRDRLFAAACAHGLWAGWSLFGSIAFIPLFVQTVLGTSATTAGATLIPMNFGWVFASAISSRLLLRTGNRVLAVMGMCSLVVGTFLMSRIDAHSSHLQTMINVTLMGIGMGMSVPSFMIAVQTTVPRSALGAATSAIAFARSIGGAFGVSIMGAVMSTRLASSLAAAGLDPAAISLNRLLDPLARSATSAALQGTLRDALAGAIQGVFVVAFIAALLALASAALAPRGRLAQRVAPTDVPEAAAQPASAGMPSEP